MDSVVTGRALDGMPPLRVLCVDDNRDVADSTVDLLRTVGFDARACYDGESALVQADTFLPGLCLIDLNMPGMDGDQLAMRLREWAAGRPLVLVAMTAMNNEASCRRISDAGFDLHLVKPVDPRKLLAVVDHLWQVCEHAMRRSCGSSRGFFRSDGSRSIRYGTGNAAFSRCPTPETTVPRYSLETIILILVLLWLLGAFIAPFGGDIIHLLLVVILVVVVIRVLDGRRVR